MLGVWTPLRFLCGPCRQGGFWRCVKNGALNKIVNCLEISALIFDSFKVSCILYDFFSEIYSLNMA